ncbi:helix-turn-helix transcriptional regulator [Jhaorihella thermophila]|uniref:Helix-turn-helix domain-containing protein n=1 Tax=Jhaorihella thermophila TaxID=488547 RepID=A0A1H5WV25_9RHOB|nr:helix-turn-helix domain-containing protein [Jhaorihella thermophila]SEG02797.1 Helix-turn-helix domain-containing protein [Jhaorihella thermophila]
MTNDCNPAKRIPAADVRQLCGGVSDMTLWRWLHHDDLNFPRPIYIGRRRYWREADVIAWLEAQEVAA